MTGFVMFLHAIISIALVTIILMQSGRGGGLTEGFASAESMFGAKTNELLVKGTTVFAGLFLITCLSLAILSAQKGKSLMSGVAATEVQELPPVEINEAAVEEVNEAVGETVGEGVQEMNSTVTQAADQAGEAVDQVQESETPEPSNP